MLEIGMETLREMETYARERSDAWQKGMQGDSHRWQMANILSACSTLEGPMFTPLKGDGGWLIRDLGGDPEPEEDEEWTAPTGPVTITNEQAI
jgi:hypothetical protein